MRYLRAAAATALLILLIAGPPLLLATTVGNPLSGWPALRAGDISDDVILDVLTFVAWLAWAQFTWAVSREIVLVAAGLPAPQLPTGASLRATWSRPQQWARTLVTTAFLVLPTTAPAAFGAGPNPHLTLTTAPHNVRHPLVTREEPPTRVRPGASTDPPEQGQAQPGPLGRNIGAAGASNARSGPTHRQAGDVGSASPVPSEFAWGAGAGLVAGVSLRELARLRRRQWRHRRPSRSIATTPSDLVDVEKSLTRAGATAPASVDTTSLLAAYANTHDQPMPPARGQAPWDALCDAAGAPLPRLISAPSALPPGAEVAAQTADPPASWPPSSTQNSEERSQGTRRQPDKSTDPRPQVHMPAESVLDPTPEGLLTATASTERDVKALAPRVSEPVRRLVRHSDPDLDGDLADWYAADTSRPRLSVLGPPTVRASGQLPTPRPRVPWHTEVVAYLAAHPRGVTPERLGTDLWPDDPDITSKPKLRQAVYNVRRWLATNPDTGQDYLPQASHHPGDALHLYRLNDVLVDAELFRRLRLRGVTRGPQGIHDLAAALDLVTGPAYDPARRRAGGYSWLIDTPTDIEYTAMIVDVAHLLATHHLNTGHPELAVSAARLSLAASPHDDIPLLDLVAACDAQGHHAEADTWIQQILTTHGAEVEEDLPPRTAEVLHRRQWHRAS